MTPLEIIAGITAVLWTFFRASSWRWFRKSASLDRLYDAMEIGVLAAWEQVIKPHVAKNGRGDPLPPDIRARAELVAVNAATSADPIVGTFKADVLRSAIKLAVEEAKRRGGL